MFLSSFDIEPDMPTLILATTYDIKRHAFRDLHWYMYGGNSWGGPGCKITSVLNGGPLRACGGCKHVFYCSRTCQREAWKRQDLPHKTVCESMCIFMQRVDEQLASMPQTQSAFEEVCVSLAQRDESLARLVFDYVRVLYYP